MLSEIDVVSLSRLQFGLTALYHFLFVPLTIGLSIILAIMETVYVMTGKPIWKEMVKYWGILFGINFAMGVATGITMEFQFGTNWAYYSHYVGDIFGVPLALEGMMAFFLEATFVGLFFFGWERLSQVAHLVVTWLLALGTNFSALWILIANAWMQHPVGAEFNFKTMRMELTSFFDVFFNPVAQAKFVHTVSAGYVTGAMFVLSISAYYLLRKRNIEFAKRSMTVAASFGLASALSVVVLGDESGYLANSSQHMKLAAVEAMWKTESTPAGLTLFGIPDQEKQVTYAEIKVPYLLGLIAARSIYVEILGIDELVTMAKVKIKNGVKAYEALERLQLDPDDSTQQAILKENQKNLGYALLLKRHAKDIYHANEKEINAAALDTVPPVAPLFWSFRVMVACGFYFIILFAIAFYLASFRRFDKVWFLKMALWSLPLPWLAAEFGWVVAEVGRQPWIIDGIMPTYVGTSSLTAAQLWTSLAGFVIFYSALAVVEVYLLQKYIRLGPDNLTHHQQGAN